MILDKIDDRSQKQMPTERRPSTDTATNTITKDRSMWARIETTLSIADRASGPISDVRTDRSGNLVHGILLPGRDSRCARSTGTTWGSSGVPDKT